MPGVKGRSGGQRTGAGRPSYVPSEADRYTVQVLRACGVRHDTIAQCLGVALGTLAKHYKDELDAVGEAVIAKIGEGVMRRALDGDNTCSLFVLKTRAGWKEAPQRLEHCGPEGLPIATTAVSMEQFRKAVREVKDEY
jgi:hypothetical protein